MHYIIRNKMLLAVTMQARIYRRIMCMYSHTYNLYKVNYKTCNINN